MLIKSARRTSKTRAIRLQTKTSVLALALLAASTQACQSRSGNFAVRSQSSPQNDCPVIPPTSFLTLTAKIQNVLNAEVTGFASEAAKKIEENIQKQVEIINKQRNKATKFAKNLEGLRVAIQAKPSDFLPIIAGTWLAELAENDPEVIVNFITELEKHTNPKSSESDAEHEIDNRELRLVHTAWNLAALAVQKKFPLAAHNMLMYLNDAKIKVASNENDLTAVYSPEIVIEILKQFESLTEERPEIDNSDSSDTDAQRTIPSPLFTAAYYNLQRLSSQNPSSQNGTEYLFNNAAELIDCPQNMGIAVSHLPMSAFGSTDLFFALGRFRLHLVTIKNINGQYYHQIYISDIYDWHNDKSVTVDLNDLGIKDQPQLENWYDLVSMTNVTISDAMLGQLHVNGLARQYNIFGRLLQDQFPVQVKTEIQKAAAYFSKRNDVYDIKEQIGYLREGRIHITSNSNASIDISLKDLKGMTTWNESTEESADTSTDDTME